jgi:hypothetical protein
LEKGVLDPMAQVKKKVNNSALDGLKRLNAFSPLPFNAAMDAQRIHGTERILRLVTGYGRDNGLPTCKPEATKV